jgi:hypothetical protein
LKLSTLPFSKNESGRIAAGAFSRESIVVTRPLGRRMTMKPPPPMPHENGSVTPSTAAAAIAASTALPPRRRTRVAAFVATPSAVATAPPLPLAVGCGTCVYGCAPTAVGTARIAPTPISAEMDRPDIWPPLSRRGAPTLSC